LNVVIFAFTSVSAGFDRGSFVGVRKPCLRFVAGQAMPASVTAYLPVLHPSGRRTTGEARLLQNKAQAWLAHPEGKIWHDYQ
jgi:hypothetical protein